LRVAWHQVNSLVTPFDIFTIHVENDPLNGPVGGESNCLAVTSNFELETEFTGRREIDEFEWFRPGAVVSESEKRNI